MTAKIKFYRVYEASGENGIVYPPEKYSYDYNELIVERDVFPEVLYLEDGPPTDYLSNNFGRPLVSEKLKNVFDGFRDTTIPFRWTQTLVKVPGEEEPWSFYFLVFSGKVDVLDKQKTRFVQDEDYIYPFFLYERIKDLSFFPEPSLTSNSIIVSQQLKKEIEKHKITGISFELADVTF